MTHAAASTASSRGRRGRARGRETHVDRNIDEPAAFLTTNVLAPVVLEAARRHGTRVLMISTDGWRGRGGAVNEDAPPAPQPMRPARPPICCARRLDGGS
jgi:dTDP-D-glucose 4,6-dehydratase